MLYPKLSQENYHEFQPCNEPLIVEKVEKLALYSSENYQISEEYQYCMDSEGDYNDY